MEDQGIMSLPQAGMQAPTAQPQAAIDPKNFSPQVFDYARMQPEQFGQDIMGGMEAADPAMVAEFKQALAGMRLPPEVIDALGDMVDTILNDPESYDEIRTEFVSEGIPEEILPPTFDAAYFAALNIALDQLSAQQGPVGMARGGIMALSPVATELAKMGRGGDRMIAHVTPAEARMLRRRGGSGTINPYTGQPEFLKKFVKSVVKTITQPIKSAGKAVKGLVKGVGNVVKKIASSPIGRMVLTAAAVYFMGPAATQFLGGLGVTNAALVTGINTFAASTAVSLASGENLKDSLKTGVVSGVLAGVTTGVVKGFDATAPGAPVSPGPNVEVNPLGETGGTTVQRLAPISDATQTVADVSATSNVVTPNTVNANVLTPEMVTSGPDLTAGQTALTYEPNFRMEAGGFDLAQNAGTTASDVTSGIGNVSGATPSLNAIDPYTELDLRAGQAPTISGPEMAGPPGPSLYDQYVKPGVDYVTDFYKAQPSQTDISDAFNKEIASRQALGLDTTSAAAREAAYTKAVSAAQPTFGTLSRLGATGVGGLALAGGFKKEEPGSPDLAPKETGFDLMQRQPEIYGTSPGGAETTYASLPTSAPQAGSSYQFNPIQMQQIQYPSWIYGNQTPQRMFAQGGIAAVAPARYNLGGYASGGIGSMAKKYPRRTGQISGPGTGTSDSIPAMLSDGEFVMTAKAVRGAGGGSRREGARKMYQMMRKFERNS
jgi:hypothetical protein